MTVSLKALSSYKDNPWVLLRARKKCKPENDFIGLPIHNKQFTKPRLYLMKSNFISKRHLSFLTLVFCLFSGLSFAQDLPWANSAEEVGMSTEQLNRINDVMRGHIDAGTIQGAVTGVARRGKIVHLETHGLMNVADGKPMQAVSYTHLTLPTKA